MKHTPEPWEIEQFPGTTCGISGSDGDAVVWHSELCEEGIPNDADAYRIVACVNACAGIDNPAEAIAEAREALERLISLPSQCQCEISDTELAVYDQARSALAKLKGGAE